MRLKQTTNSSKSAFEGCAYNRELNSYLKASASYLMEGMQVKLAYMVEVHQHLLEIQLIKHRLNGKVKFLQA